MKMWANEFLKIKRSKSVRVLFLVFVGFILLASLMGENKGSDLMRSGFAAPFMWNGIMGAAGLFAYGAIAAGMIASEFELGVVRNAIGCGVTRSRYFAVKVSSVLGISLVLYLVCNCIFTVVMTVHYGFDPKGLLYSDYWTKVVVFNAVALTVQLASVAIYICFAYIFRAASAAFVFSVLETIIEAFISSQRVKSMRLSGRGLPCPFDTMWVLPKHFTEDTILTEEFALLAVPCICILSVSLLISYILFMKRGI